MKNNPAPEQSMRERFEKIWEKHRSSHGKEQFLNDKNRILSFIGAEVEKAKMEERERIIKLYDIKLGKAK